ncbi:MAG: cellulase family glycosylhydrolase [Coriobacteriales bacterium]|nr:cellulase family glycosylhydrolase [Coriobacteriales bacterium]
MGKCCDRIWHGVNLGNWLVLERWMSPSLFEGSLANDVYGLERHVAPEVLQPRLCAHYQTYVTQKTFETLAGLGVDLVRLPVPYWVFGSAHHEPVVQYVDKAFEWARKTGIRVLLDLHTVPGSQNGFDNGGVCGLVTWHLDSQKVDFAIDVVRRLAERYGKRAELFGIEPLNEPVNRVMFRHASAGTHGKDYPERVAASQPIPRSFLRAYYQRCYGAIRAACGEEVAVVLHDHFCLRAWNRFMRPQDGYANVWIDTHQYAGFCDGWMVRKRVGLYEWMVRHVLGPRVARAARHHPVLVGEWSCANHIEGLRSKGEHERKATYLRLWNVQVATWNRCNGGCFWSLSNDGPYREGWSLLGMAKRGWVSYDAS